MASELLNPSVLYGQQQMSQEADLTGQQMVPWQDHWKLVALVLRQILYRVVAKFLRYRWHSLVEKPQKRAGICMTSPLDHEFASLIRFPSSEINCSPSLHQAPPVSKATATKAWVFVMVEYFVLFDSAARSAASPALIDVWAR